MRLTSEQRHAVQSLASEYVVDVESPERAVQQALDAIVVGDANPIAEMVTEAAGVEWITPHVWAREEPRMTAETAREIIKDALASEVWETPAPEDDAQAIKDAAELVKMAEDAWENNIRGPEVESILKIAAGDEDAPAPAAKKAPAKPGAKKPAPKKPGRPAPKKPEPEPEADAPEEPWEGYDSNTVKEIVEGVEVWGDDLDENLVYVLNLYAYEQANKNRKNIIAACEAIIPAESLPTAGAVEPDPAEEQEAAREIPEEWEAEPFETYDKLKVADIKESLTDYFEDEDISTEDKLSTLGHVSYYEGANKARTGLVEYLEGIQQAYEEATDGDDAEGATEEAGEAEDAAAPEADAPAASRPARSSRGGKKAAPAAAEGDPGDATGGVGSSFLVTVGDVAFSLSGKHAVAGTVLDLIEQGVTSISISIDG